MTDLSTESIGYASAMDMPSFAEMKKEADGLALLSFLLSKEDRAKLRATSSDMQALAGAVDRFYEALGGRHWIFHDRLPTTLVRDTVLMAANAEDAERALCAIYEDPEQLNFMIMPVMRFPEMRARKILIDHARVDFEEKRYYVVVLSLLTVMDGFVNDVQKIHRGLHARDAEELQSWDTAVGHHMGLTATQASFRKSYTRRVDDEFHDLARNGILHGNITNYDNVVVASKAWNRLFAVVDWATSLEEEAKPKKPEPTWREVIQRVKDNADFQVKLDNWTGSAGVVESEDEYANHEATRAATEFLQLWMHSNWGHLATRFMLIGQGEAGKPTPKEIKSNFSPYPLESFRILRYEITAPAIAEVHAELTIRGQSFPAVLRLTYAAPDGSTRVEGLQEGQWKMVPRSPDMFNSDLWKVASY